MKALSEEHPVEFRAHEHAMSSNIRDVVRELEKALGATMVAAIGGVSEARAVKQWMTDREPQRPHVLRFALQLAWIICEKSDRHTARAWFQGVNPHLNDAVPLLLLRQRPLYEVQGPLMAAARAFRGHAITESA
ncbi:MAG TPA: hypothetical protein VFO29_02970 [Candidatus Rubrimentiphilum sp.]|nr:hypothetical protein [Candidatus Rubrimentiphilum sp.]